MKQIATILLMLIAAGCSRREYGPELHERAVIKSLKFRPEYSSVQMVPTFDADGDMTMTMVPVYIPPYYAAAFECDHGRFLIEDERVKDVVKMMAVGEAVNVVYCQSYDVSKKETNYHGMHFLRAEPLPEQEGK